MLNISKYTMMELVALNDLLAPTFKVIFDDSKPGWKDFKLRYTWNNVVTETLYTESNVLDAVAELNQLRIHSNFNSLLDSIGVTVKFGVYEQVVYYLLECSLSELPLLIHSDIGWVRAIVKYRLSINK